ncbi:ABC transporter permease [Nitratireductor sp. XY-223]|uniref:ABC transporter permease n=1 Tax=Nitratireductor sp. XY-223 TaxID=2561926 RepID=UPI0010AA1906|nr:ABC transporter permease [Nitratireductor sp. XY-223]
MLFKVEARQEPSRKMALAAPLIATGLTVVISSLFFLSLGLNPFVTLYTFFVQPLTTMNGISEWLLKASPLILIACGLAVAFRANVWNIGAEGQLIMGAIAAAGVGLFSPFQESIFLLPLMVVCGMLAGAAWAAIPAFLKARMNTNEILVTLMLTYVATLILSYLVHGPWRDPDGFNFPQTALLPYAGMFEVFDYSYRLNTSIFFTVVAVILAWLFMERSFLGYKMAVGGVAPAAARFAGFKSSSSIWVGLLVSGATAGLAGMTEVSGPLGQLSSQISPGYGFAAIIVAFIGRLNAFGIVLGGLLLSLLYLGGETVQLSLGLPSSIALIFQGMLLFFLLASNFLINFRIRAIAVRAH